MISYIKGELTEISENSIVVENSSGIGFKIGVSSSFLNNMYPVGSDVKIYTYLNVKEDDMELFGFQNKDEQNVFKLLIAVSGIGPKGALAILSTLNPDDLRLAVISDDAKAISKAPGIGSKMAQKVIIELKDKLKLEDVFEQKMSFDESAKNENSNSARNDTIQALVALGYGRSEAVKAVSYVEDVENKDSETVLKEALKKLAIF